MEIKPNSLQKLNLELFKSIIDIVEKISNNNLGNVDIADLENNSDDVKRIIQKLDTNERESLFCFLNAIQKTLQYQQKKQ